MIFFSTKVFQVWDPFHNLDLKSIQSWLNLVGIIHTGSSTYFKIQNDFVYVLVSSYHTCIVTQFALKFFLQACSIRLISVSVGVN